MSISKDLLRSLKRYLITAGAETDSTLEPVSVVVTSCGRFDLLQKTIDSFLQFNTYSRIAQIIIIDDSGQVAEAKAALGTVRESILASSFCKHGACDVKLIINDKNIGQVASIDLAYGHVTSPYVFHLEDDWEFFKSGFIEYSFDVLKRYPWIVTVWLRAHNDTMGHPIEFVNELPFGLLELNYLERWHGFTWNPGLRRHSDYQAIKSFSEHAPGESLAGGWYMKRGYRAAICSCSQGYVKHIGWERSTANMSGTNKAI